MRKAIFKADPNKGGFIRATLTPVNERESRFVWWDLAIMIAGVVLLTLLARLLLAR